MPIRSGAMQRPRGCRYGNTLRQRYDEVGLRCSSTMGSPSPTSTYAISLPRTRRRCFWYGNAAEIMLASPSFFVVAMLASPSFFVVAAADDLAEVALLIKDADADHRQTEITCRLQLVAGDVAEATRVDREGLAERELHAEVGHASQRRLAERLLEPGRRGQVPTS